MVNEKVIVKSVKVHPLQGKFWLTELNEDLRKVAFPGESIREAKTDLYPQEDGSFIFVVTIILEDSEKES